MKTRHLILSGLLLLLVTLVFLGPRVFPWKVLESRITDTVRDATGLTMRIDGDVEVTLFPAIEIAVGDVRFASPHGVTGPDPVTIGSLRARIRAWPLLGSRIVVDTLVVEGLNAALVIDETGKRNWTAIERRTRERDAFPFADIALRDVRVIAEALRFRNASTGTSITGSDVELEISLASLDDPLGLTGRLRLNHQPVDLNATIGPLWALLEGRATRVSAQADAAHLAGRLEAELRFEPVLRVDGEGTLDIESVAALAARLDASAQEDPAPLRIHASFTGEHARITLDDVTIEGAGLSASAAGNLELAEEEIRVTAKLEAELLDLDRYLTAFRAGRESASRPSPVTGNPGTYLATLPDTPIGLEVLRKLSAEVSFDAERIRLGGHEVAPVRGRVRARQGLLEARLDALGVYRGMLDARVHADATRNRLSVETEVEITGVDAAALASAAAPDAPSVVGLASVTASLRSEGRSVRDLARQAIGRLEVDIDSDGPPLAAGQISELSLALERPALDARTRLSGDAVYNGERVNIDLGFDSLHTLLAGEPLVLEAAMTSRLATARYEGTVYQEPVPSLDGRFEAAAPSFADTARWLGYRAPQVDPGAVSLDATFRSDGRAGTLREVHLRGDGLDVRANGEFESVGSQLRFDLSVRGGVLELDRYLAPGVSGTSPVTDPLATLSDAELHLSPLRTYTARIALGLQGVRTATIEAGRVDLLATLDAGLLDIQLERLELPHGIVTGAARVDGTGDTLDVRARAAIDDLGTEPLAAAVQVIGALERGATTASVELTARGRSPRRLAADAACSVRIRTPAITIADGPFSRLSGLEVAMELPGAGAEVRARVTTRLQVRATGQHYPVELRGQLGPLLAVIAHDELPLDMTMSIGTTTLRAHGRFEGIASTPRPELSIFVRSARLSELGVDTTGRIADTGPVSVSSLLRTSDGGFELRELDVRVGRSDLGGHIEVALDRARPRILADLHSTLIDLQELMPFDREAAATPAPVSDTTRLIADGPLPIVTLDVDGTLMLAVSKLVRDIGSQIDDVVARLALDRGRLEIGPVTGSFAGGRTELNLLLDARASPVRMELRAHEQQMLLGTFVPMFVPSGESEGRADVDVELGASGNSLRELAANLAGHVRLVAEGGAVDSNLLRAMVAGVGDVLGPFIRREGSTSLNCLVTSLEFENGVGTGRTLLADFPSVSIAGRGTVNLATETLDFRFATHSRNASLATLAAPFVLTGTLASPRVQQDRAGAAVRGVGALLNPVALVGTLATLSATRRLGENPCVAALRQAGQVEAAPSQGSAPGATGRSGGVGRRLRNLLGGE